MAQMDSTIVNISLSAIKTDLHSTISLVQWITSGYLLALALVLPLHGWLVDRFGIKKLYISCFALFTLASLLCGCSQTMPQLIGARVLQGIVGGLLAPLAQLMLARIAGKDLARVMGYAVAPVLLAPLLGPFMAGWILKYASWQWLFYVNLPVGVSAVVLSALVIPTDKGSLHSRPFDVLGFLTLSPGLTSMLYGLERYAQHRELGFLLLGFACIAVFIWLTKGKQDKALIDLELFKIRSFAIAAVIQFFSNGVAYAAQFLIPFYLISGVGLSAVKAGWYLSLMGVGMLCIYPLIGFLTDRLGNRAVAAGGALLNLVGTLPFLWMTYSRFSIAFTVIALLMRGIGQGSVGIPTIATAYTTVPTDKLNYATTAINIVQRLGGPIATTIVAIVMSLGAGAQATLQPQIFLLPFIALLGFQILVLGSAVRLPNTNRST